MTNAQRAKEERDFRRERGLCMYSGCKEDKLPSLVYCDVHAEANRARWRAWRDRKKR